MSDYIRAWPYREAPEGLQRLSRHGGDEDWLAVVPRSMCDDAPDDWPRPPLAGDATYPDGYSHERNSWPLPRWMQEGGTFGVCCVSVYPHPGSPDHVVVIGAHA